MILNAVATTAAKQQGGIEWSYWTLLPVAATWYCHMANDGM